MTEINMLDRRYDFVLIFDIQDGNPNGDPDAGNLPRIDPETGQGIVTDVCLKRKIRDFVILSKGQTQYFDIWVKSKSLTLNEQVERAYDEDQAVIESAEAWRAWQKDKKKNPKPERHYEDVARDWMCKQFFDIRTFGAVMSTSDKPEREDGGESSKLKKTAGQVRGPVQMTFGRSVDPIVALEHSISVCAARKADKPVESQIGIQGRKNTIPYGVYVAHGFVSAHLAAQTRFSKEDLNLLWDALCNMFEHDRSAARGLMSTRKLFVFEHENSLGKAPAYALFDLVRVKRKDESKPARSFADYNVTPGAEIQAGLPQGVTLHEMP
jgi:CRISPR-associated protein Csd2